MIEKRRTNNAFVIGTYKLTDGLVHALTVHDSPGRREAPLKTVCGSFQRVHYASPFISPIEQNDLSDITCKRCLGILKQKGLLKVKKAKTIKLLGTHRYAGFCPIHALVEREPKPSDALVKREPRPSDNPKMGIPPFRSLCKAYPDVYRTDEAPSVLSHSTLASMVTCRECLSIMKKTGMLLEKDFPAMIKTEKPAKEKFFLVFYDGGTIDNVYDFEELLQDAHRFKPTINKILLVESYKEISVKEIVVVVDEDGNEITKKDL